MLSVLLVIYTDIIKRIDSHIGRKMSNKHTENNTKECIDTVFNRRQKFILIGLTGRTGSGCSTTSELLSKSFEDLNPPKPKYDDFNNNEERKYNIIYNYAKDNWNSKSKVDPIEKAKFCSIKIANVLTFFIIKKGEENLKKYLEQHHKFDDNYFEKNDYKKIISEFDKLKNPIDRIDNNDESDTASLYRFIIEDLRLFKKDLKEFLNKKNKSVFIKLFQELGNNIRFSGDPYIKERKKDKYKPEAVYTIPEQLKKFIKIIRKYNNEKKCGTFIVIDAIRNPFEARYFHDKYSAFYLLAIKCNDNERKERLRDKYNLNNDEIDRIDNIEYIKNNKDEDEANKKLLKFTNLNVKECISNSDIHLYNPKGDGQDYTSLTKQILKYIALIMHPGLVTPSTEESLMQMAYNIKLNSGCISRQVGAVVTNKYYSVQAIGWNEVAEGQTPCLLRNAHTLLRKQDNVSYSEYEKSECFSKRIKYTYENSEKGLQGRNSPYCFKDIENKYNKEKNQVHTRALHAEENAFLQISKYGGAGVKGGYLFVTSVPCVLCSKKSYQLGIKKIYYIDPYPDIAETHILKTGNANTAPELVLFYGATGGAYAKLFNPIMSYKDELDALIDFKYLEKYK